MQTEKRELKGVKRQRFSTFFPVMLTSLIQSIYSDYAIDGSVISLMPDIWPLTEEPEVQEA